MRFTRTAVLGKLIQFLLFITIVCFSCKAEKDQPDPPYKTGPDTVYTYTNPLSNITDIGDPYVLRYGGRYYMFATSSGIGFKVWQSDNMVDWVDKGLALNRDNSGNMWGKGNFWAPEVKYYKGKFYMTYSAIGDNNRMKVRIACSDSPVGPFINWSEPFYNDDAFSYIDADLYFDADKAFLFFVKDCSENIIGGKHVSQIYVSKISADLTHLIGSPSLILSPDQSWEGITGDWMWNEGPFVMKHDRKLYLFYSANVYSSSDYSVGVAMADSANGTWTKYQQNPVLNKDLSINVSGPGHCMVTSSPDSTEFFIVYHTHTFPSNPSGNRNMCMDRLVFENGIPRIIGPTRTPQALPSGIKYIIRK